MKPSGLRDESSARRPTQARAAGSRVQHRHLRHPTSKFACVPFMMGARGGPMSSRIAAMMKAGLRDESSARRHRHLRHPTCRLGWSPSTPSRVTMKPSGLRDESSARRPTQARAAGSRVQHRHLRHPTSKFACVPFMMKAGLRDESSARLPTQARRHQDSHGEDSDNGSNKT